MDSVESGIRTASPYLDAQIAVPLLVLGLALYWSWRGLRRDEIRPEQRLLRVICSCSAVLLILFLAVSVQPLLSVYFGGVFDILQFPYRLTAYVNLSALTAVLALIALMDRSLRTPLRPPQWLTFILGVCVAFSFSAVLLKLVHADAIRSDDVAMNMKRLTQPPHLDLRAEQPPRTVPADSDDLPRTFYGSLLSSVAKDFMATVPSGFENRLRIRFHPENGVASDRVQDVTIQLQVPTLLVTNIEPFPWNILTVDGVALRPNQLFAQPDESFPHWMKALMSLSRCSPESTCLDTSFARTGLWCLLNRSLLDNIADLDASLVDYRG